MPGTARIATGFDATTDVPGWKNTGGTYVNSGVELALQPGAPAGYVNASGYVAFLRGSDGGAYQVTGQDVAPGQVYRLNWKAASLATMAGTANMQVRLFRTTDNGTTRIPLATSADLLGTNQIFETFALEYTTVAADAGGKLGIEIENLATTAGVIGFDDFQLELNPTGPGPATGLPSLAWDSGTTDDGTVTFSSSTTYEREYHFRIQPQASLNGGWRTVLRVAQGNANVYLRQTGWPNVTTSNFKSERETGDDGFVVRKDQYSAGQTWYLTVRAMANTSFTLLTGDIFVQDLGTLGFTDANANGQYDIGEAILPSGSGQIAVKGEGMRFFKNTVPAGVPAWSLWLNGDLRDIAVMRAEVPYHVTGTFTRKQAGQMLVSQPLLSTGTDTYFVSVLGAPGDLVNLDSRIQQVEEMSFHSTTADVAVSGPPYRVYRTNVPVDQIAWDVSVTANSGNPNVCVRRANVSTEFDNDGYSEAAGNVNDSITLVPDFLTNGTWFVTVYGTGNYNFTLKSGDPVVTPISFTDTKINEQTNRAGWRFYALTNIPSQLGPLGWELYLSNQVPGSQISIRRNKVPGRWQYRAKGDVKESESDFAGFSSTSGFLQRPGHQADVWYVGVFTPQQPLGAFQLDVRPIQPPTVAFNNSLSSPGGVKAGEWKYVRVVVPEGTGIKGWDVGLKNISGAGDPKLVVCRDRLPIGTSTTLSQTSGSSTWPAGQSWVAQVDWTKRTNESGGSPNVTFRRLVMAYGRPLEPGIYYVGIYNAGTADISGLMVESRGIGEGLAFPVTDLAYAAGSSSTISGLAPREAKYFKVTIPENTPSWEFTLDPTLGEMMAVVRRGHIPDFGAPPANSLAAVQSLQSAAPREATIQKDGAERFVLLPPSGTYSLLPDDYYIAVVSEGQDPAGKLEVGGGVSSGVLTSRGALAVTQLGTVGTSGLVQPVTLVGGQVKAFQYQVPPGLYSIEIHLDNRSGNPWSNTALNNRTPLPPPNITNSAKSYYGSSGGQEDPGEQGGLMWNISNPAPGPQTVVIRASPSVADNMVFPDAATDLRIVGFVPEPLTFNGGNSSIADQQAGTWRYYRVDVPDSPGLMGWDVRLRNVSGAGRPTVQIRRDYVPAGVESFGWAGSPSSSATWPSGAQVSAQTDWTGRAYDGSSSTVPVDTHRFVTGIGRPLQPGTYYVGVYNYAANGTVNYTLESYGIGEGQAIPVEEMPYAGGNPSEIVNQPAREARYYKVSIPENTPSWEFTVDATQGEFMAVIRRGAIPDFGAQSATQTIEQVQGGESGPREVKVQKTGSERFAMLPLAGQTMLVPGDYYIAVVSEGATPTSAQRTGEGPSTGTMRANGFIPVTDMGTATATGVTRAVELAGGQIKIYRFAIPPGTESAEVRLGDRTGNPWLSMYSGIYPPRPSLLYSGSSSTGYGISGGQTGPPFLEDDDLLTLANPAPGEYSVVVRASASGTGQPVNFPNATANLTVIARKPQPIAFDGGSAEVTAQAPGSWRYFEVVVPLDAGILGWDLRVKNVTGSGIPKLSVRRDQLPSGTSNIGWGGKPSQLAAWASGNQWMAQVDWSRRAQDAGSTTDVSSRRLVMGTGRPLEPGTYLVGVQNTSASAVANYTIESRGIGTGRLIPVGNLSFSGGSVTVANLVPREAAYYKVSIPANTPSWEFTLDPTVGEMMAVVRRGAIPDFGGEAAHLSDGELQSVATVSHREATVQKSGPERYTVLPTNGQDFILEGDYYIAVVSEGQNPSQALTQMGTGTSSGVLQSRGILAITDLGSVPVAGVSRAVSLLGGQVKAYQFTVPDGLAGVEIRLDDRVGNPWFSVIKGARLPKPSKLFQSTILNEYGFCDGQIGTTYAQDESSITLAAPEPGVYSVMVRASANPAAHTLSALDSSATLFVRPKLRTPLNFSPSQNPGGGTNTDTRQITDAERSFYEVAVPTTLNGEPVTGWILRTSFQQGSGTIKVYKNWGNPGSGITVNTRTAVIVPPFLTPGDTWFVEVTGSGLTNYSITSEPVTLNRPAWAMPAGHNNTFGDSGTALSGDKGIDLGQDDWHFYAVDIPVGNSGLLRTELQAINGNPNLYIREDGVPTTDHSAGGSSGASLTPRVLNSTGSEYGNWVPLDGRVEKWLRPGRWFLGVKATGSSNARYRLIVSNGRVNELQLSGGVASSQLLVGRDWRYYRVNVPVDAPVDWKVFFTQQVGDVVMHIRDSLPPGNATNGQETTGWKSWVSDQKNQGPYSPAAGHDAPDTYTFNTPPIRPGSTYYVGIKAVTDATFSVGSSVSTTTIGTFPTLDFYTGTLELSVPAGSSDIVYQIPVPADATRMKWSSTHAASLQVRIEQGTLPGTTGTAQHFRSTGVNSWMNSALTNTGWPWQPSKTYYLRLVNSGTTDVPLTLTMSGKNAATEDEDSDGLPDAWEIQYFGNTQRNASADPDQDGVTNAVEYADGTNPADGSSALYFVEVTASRGLVTKSPDLPKYARGQALALTPLPDSGLSFIGWSGTHTGSTPAALTVTSNHVIHGNFGLPLPVALDAPSQGWSTGGPRLWFGQSTTTHDTVDAAQSGVLDHGQESWFETTVYGPGTLDFRWKVSSQPNGDYLEFYINGTLQTGRISGEVNWTQKSYTLTAGAQTLRWRYVKNTNITAGADTGWVDTIAWSGTGMYASWIAANFNSEQQGDPLISGPDADPDRDGLINQLECAFNLPPQAPGILVLAPGTGTSGLPSITASGTGAARKLRLEYIRRKSGFVYTPEVTGSLTGADWNPAAGTPVVTSIDPEWERVVIEDSVGTGAAKRFGRVRVADAQ